MDSIQFNPSKKIWKDISVVAADEGLSLYDLKRSGNVLNVFVDKKEGGVSIDDCSCLHRRLNTFLMVNGSEYGIDPQKVTFEVSSPGIYRVLRLEEHYKEALDKDIQVVLRQPISADEKKISKIRGKLVEFDGEAKELSIEVEDNMLKIELNNIKKANIA